MHWLVEWLRDALLWQLVPVVVVENVVLHVVAIGLGEVASRRFAHRRVSEPAPPTTRLELTIVCATLLMNSVTTLAAVLLWRHGIVRVRWDPTAWAVVDTFLLLLVMDGAMYALHRVAHLPWVYPWLHQPHHEYDKPRPLTLLILNPLENLAFGLLILVVLAAYPFHVVAVGVFFVFNIVSGIVGHLGVEPLPDWWVRTPVVMNVTGGSFHARHHQDVTANFGFYTIIWDRVFGTLRKDYASRFGRLPEESTAPRDSRPE